ncbi:MAG: hypothetical protein ABJA64_01210, partial [Candidatus Saccharibacteria bacterium]
EKNQPHEVEWEANRELAKGLLNFLQTEISKHGKTWQDIEAIGVFKGPGSFTGLRIGLTVLNTMADALNIPIVGAVGEEWSERVLEQLQSGQNDRIVLPEYGSEAHITKPRK